MIKNEEKSRQVRCEKRERVGKLGRGISRYTHKENKSSDQQAKQ